MLRETKCRVTQMRISIRPYSNCYLMIRLEYHDILLACDFDEIPIHWSFSLKCYQHGVWNENSNNNSKSYTNNEATIPVYHQIIMSRTEFIFFCTGYNVHAAKKKIEHCYALWFWRFQLDGKNSNTTEGCTLYKYLSLNRTSFCISWNTQ